MACGRQFTASLAGALFCAAVACTDGGLERHVAEAHAAILRDAKSRIDMDGAQWALMGSCKKTDARPATICTEHYQRVVYEDEWSYSDFGVKTGAPIVGMRERMMTSCTTAEVTLSGHSIAPGTWSAGPCDRASAVGEMKTKDPTNRMALSVYFDQAAFDFAQCNTWDERCAIVRGAPTPRHQHGAPP